MEHGDYYLPDLELLEDEEACYGKYGMLRKTYLKEHRKPYYQMLILHGKLNEHLNNRVDREAYESTGDVDGRKTGSYGADAGRPADAMGTKDEWNKDCSRGNSVIYR